MYLSGFFLRKKFSKSDGLFVHYYTVFFVIFIFTITIFFLFLFYFIDTDKFYDNKRYIFKDKKIKYFYIV